MPEFAVYYATENEWCVTVDADDEDHARQIWWDSAYWTRDPEMVREDMMDTSVNVEEI